jgi:alpha-galactosidase
MELWEQDFRIPLSYGFRHCLGENGGPGALFHALRSFELIMPICRDMEELCPDALQLNFTNPEARVLHAICHLTQVTAAGICHGFFSAQRAIAGYLDTGVEDLEITSAGMNHFYCVLSVRRKGRAEELLPQVMKLALEDPQAEPLFKKFVEVYNVFTFVSDDHTGEYLSFGSEFQGTKWRYGRESAAVGTSQASISRTLEEYGKGELPVDTPAALADSGEITVPVICDLEFDGKRTHPAINVLNTDSYIENLPRDVVVEVPAMVDAEGIHPRHVGPLPEAFAAHMRPQYSIHGLLTEAYRTRSRRLLLQALLLDPVVNSITSAEKMLDEMLEIQKDYLPTFS